MDETLARRSVTSAKRTARTDLVHIPFWSIDSVNVALLLDGNSAVARIVQRRAAVYLLARGIEPVACVNLRSRVVCGHIHPVKAKQHSCGSCQDVSDDTDIYLIPDTSLQSDTPGFVSSGWS